MNMIRWIKTHRYCLAGLYGVVFLAGFLVLELIAPEPVYIIHCRLDDLIPFNEYFIIPYFLWYAWVPVFLIWFMLTDRDSYLRLCFVMIGGAIICLFIYVIWPNGLDLRREITATNVCAEIVAFIRSMDPPCNVCPSIHVSSTSAIHLAVLSSERFGRNSRMCALSWVVTVLICISTVFVKQHSVIDVFCGVLLSLCMNEIWNKRILLFKRSFM